MFAVQDIMKRPLPELGGALSPQFVASRCFQGAAQGSGVVAVAVEEAGAVGSVVLGAAVSADGSGEVGLVLLGSRGP